jgi:diaminopimelate epimerase
MNDVTQITNFTDHSELNTGSPHYVAWYPEVYSLDVETLGRAIRSKAEYSPKGINVNFVQIQNDHSIFVRTFERGVEDETWSCGTGVTASCLMAAHNESGFNEVDVQTLGGKLTVEFERVNDKTYNNIWLIGPATYVFKGIIDTEKID